MFSIRRFLLTWYGISVMTIEMLVALLGLLDGRLGAQRDRAAARRVGLEDALPADDEAARREVRPGDRLEDRLETRVARLAAQLDERR